jgi:hypothetical protein
MLCKGTIAGHTAQHVFMLDQFTLDEGKVLLIQIFEQNGGRHQTLRISNTVMTAYCRLSK